MKIALLVLFIFTLTACKDATKDVIPADADLTKITWQDYEKWCGGHNVVSDKNFVKIMGEKITWTGIIYKITPDRSVKNSREFTGKIIKIKMKDSGSLMSDITLRVPKALKGELDKLRAKDVVQFEGALSFLGGIDDHVIEITAVRKVRARKK
ncbi:MAG: hypothetical protein HRT88_23290 [Lentisphaeraceae bacterium]|nr:hypothetical protein [Lentisphaeraceae bacterium]